MPPIRMYIILYAQTGCAITSGTKINDGINFELNTQNFLPPIITVTNKYTFALRIERKNSNRQHSPVFCGSWSQLQLYFIGVSLSTKLNAARAILLKWI